MKNLLTLIILVIGITAQAQKSVFGSPRLSKDSLSKAYIPLSKKDGNVINQYSIRADSLYDSTVFSSTDFAGAGTAASPITVKDKVSIAKFSADSANIIAILRSNINDSTLANKFYFNGATFTGNGTLASPLTATTTVTTDATPTSGSTNAVQSGGVFTALAAKAPLSNAGFTGFTSIPILKITGRVARADANYTSSGSDYLIAYTSLTVTRSVTLPTASSCPNTHFIIKDESGNASASVKITIVGTVDNVANPDAVTTPYGFLRYYSNGTAFFKE